VQQIDQKVTNKKAKQIETCFKTKEKSEKFNETKVQNSRVIVGVCVCVCVCVSVCAHPFGLLLHFRSVVVAACTLYLRFFPFPLSIPISPKQLAKHLINSNIHSFSTVFYVPFAFVYNVSWPGIVVYFLFCFALIV